MANKAVTSDDPKKSESSQNRGKYTKAKLESLYDTSEDQCAVLERANELAAGLEPEFPSLIRIMLPSHVTRVFWLGIPKTFSRDHMPKDDTMFILVDENGEEYQAKYLAEKEGLSGGWRAFSIAHKLQEGDAVVFHKVTPSKFKVYIIRSKSADRVDGSLSLNRFDDGIRKIKNTEVTARGSSRQLEPISDETMHGNIKELNVACTTKYGQIPDHDQIPDHAKIDSELSCFENFTVTVGGSIINAVISKHHLRKYYELCCSQNSFLHEHIVKPLSQSVVAGIISEMVNISDAIRACKITTSDSDFSSWDKTLQGSEILGMKVVFLRDRLHKLSKLASDSKVNREAIFARDQAVKDLIILEPKLSSAKEISIKLNLEIQALNTSSEKLEAMFNEVAKAPW